MKNKIIGLVIVLLVLNTFLASCYGTMTGTVVDAETRMPIEGAVVLVEWAKTKGLGLTYTESYKVVEVVTDKEGKFKVSGVLNPLVDPPRVTVYKKGYVAWNNNYIFPTWNRRKDFKYSNGVVINLDRFKEGFSHYDHVSFIDSAAISGSGSKLLDDAYLWERVLAQKEVEKKKATEGR